MRTPKSAAVKTAKSAPAKSAGDSGGIALPFTEFSAAEWGALRGAAPLRLSPAEIEQLRSLGDPLDMQEAERIYLPLIRLLGYYIEAGRLLRQSRRRFLAEAALPQGKTGKTPFIIGIAGSVAVGKSTAARILQQLLRRAPQRANARAPKVDLVTTDGFLYPNAALKAKGARKGFPESYDTKALLRFLSAVKNGGGRGSAPLYSHLTYDIVPGGRQNVDRPDILIIEGVNVLQVNTLPGRGLPFVSDFFDFSIYIDAAPKLIAQWYLARFKSLRQTAFQNPQSYFHNYAAMPEAEAVATAKNLWSSINLPNLEQNILPTRPRADLILRKGANHMVESVALRKL